MKPSVSVQVKEDLPLFNFLFYFPSEAGFYARLFIFLRHTLRTAHRFILIQLGAVANRAYRAWEKNEATSASIAGTVPTAGRDDFAAHVSYPPSSVNALSVQI